MPFTVDDFHDLIRILEQQPDWRAELRRFVLTEEVLALPEQLVRFQAQTDRRFQELVEAQKHTDKRLEKLAEQTDRRFRELVEAQKRTEEQIAELSVAMRRFGDDIGSLKGDLLEMRFDRRAPLYL